MKTLSTLILIAIVLLPAQADAASFTKEEARKQLALESSNLELYGNPFGASGEMDELYNLDTLEPWWKIRLDFEAWSLKIYGNPFGYFIPQKVLVPKSEPQALQDEPEIAPTTPLTGSGVSEPLFAPVEKSQPIVEEIIQSHFVGVPYVVSEDADKVYVAVQFSEPLTEKDKHQTIYRFRCVDSEGNGSYRGTYSIYDGAAPVIEIDGDKIMSTFPDSTIRGADIDKTGESYTCRFHFFSPIDIESEAISL